MSTLFLVGGVDLGELVDSKSLERAQQFDREVRLRDIGSLLVTVYKDRLDLSSRWNYESGVSLVVYNARAEGAVDVNDVFRKFFPCLNVCAIGSDNGGAIEEFLSGLEDDIAKCHDRIRRMSHWMYYQPHGGCSSKIYCMMDQLALVNSETDRGNHAGARLPIPRAIRSIDLESLLGEFAHDDAFYWGKLSTWDFQPHDMEYRELIYCSFLLLKKLSADASLTIPNNKLYLLLMTLESSYHQVNKFHNFKHAVDVMQATWRLCDRLIQDPVQILLLCIAAIGHDIGHPGTNNQLLCKFNSPVAANYHNQSVLENMHKDFLENLLNNHWPQLLTINSSKKYNKTNLNTLTEAIMATDMALHEGYVKKLEHTKDAVIDFATLISLIIKAADISNVTRPLRVSSQWACLITFEFHDCALLEKFQEEKTCDPQEDVDFDISSLTPEKLVQKFPAIPNGQVFFIETFAEHFFTEFCTKFPGLVFLIDNMERNKEFWLSKKGQ